MTCALILGSGIRLFFSPDQLAVWIHQSLERAAPPVEVVFSRARLSLAEGWIPRMGVLITGLKISPKDPCVVGGELDIDEMFVPLSLREIFRENIQFTTLQVRHAHVKIGATSCTEKAATPVSWPSGVAQVREFLDRRWVHEMMNTRKWMRGMIMDQLTLAQAGAPEAKELVIIERFSWYVPDRADETSMAKFTVATPKEQLGGLDLRPLMIRMQIQKNEIQLEGEGQHQEGRLRLAFKWTPPNDELVGGVKLSSVPARSMVVAAREAGWIPLQLSSRQAWVNCDISVRAQLGRPDTWEAQSERCRSDGDYGAVVVEKARVQRLASGFDFDVDFVLDQIDLDKVMHDIASTELKSFVSRAGRLSGKGKIGGTPLIHFEGELLGGELSLPTATGQRGAWHQGVIAARAQASWTNHRFSGLVDSFRLRRGETDAQFSFNFAEDFAEGVASLQVRQLKLPPEVFAEIIKGNAENLELYGQAQWRSGAWQDWDGRLGWSQYQSPQVQVERWKMAASGSKESSRGTVVATNLRLDPVHPWAQALSGAIGAVKAEKPAVFLKTLEGKWQHSHDGWSWEKLWAQSDLDSALLASSGHVSRGGVLTGKLTMDLPDAKALQWEIEGDQRHPLLRPMAATERLLLKRKKQEGAGDGRDAKGP